MKRELFVVGLLCFLGLQGCASDPLMRCPDKVVYTDEKACDEVQHPYYKCHTPEPTRHCAKAE